MLDDNAIDTRRRARQSPLEWHRHGNDNERYSCTDRSEDTGPAHTDAERAAALRAKMQRQRRPRYAGCGSLRNGASNAVDRRLRLLVDDRLVIARRRLHACGCSDKIRMTSSN